MIYLQYAAALINFLTICAEAVLGLRIFLTALGANESTLFVSWIREIGRPLMLPFEGMFGLHKIQGVTFDGSAIFALFVYYVIGYLAQQLIVFITGQIELSRRNKEKAAREMGKTGR